MSSLICIGVELNKIEHHPDADRLDIVWVNDYQAIVQRDRFCYFIFLCGYFLVKMSNPVIIPLESPAIPQEDQGLKKFADEYDMDKWLHIYRRPGEPALCGFKPPHGTCEKRGCPKAIIDVDHCPVCNLKTCHFCKFLFEQEKKKK